MKRTLITVLSMVALALAVPSFATPAPQMMEQGSSAPVVAVGGGPEMGLPPQAAVPAHEMAVTGEVVMSSPEEVILHTASGIRRFEITPDTQMLAGAANGDVVTVLYQPARGFVKASVVTSAPNATDSRGKVAPTSATPHRAPAVSSK
jgi:hypothetical protein